MSLRLLGWGTCLACLCVTQVLVISLRLVFHQDDKVPLGLQYQLMLLLHFLLVLLTEKHDELTFVHQPCHSADQEYHSNFLKDRIHAIFRHFSQLLLEFNLVFQVLQGSVQDVVEQIDAEEESRRVCIQHILLGGNIEQTDGAEIPHDLSLSLTEELKVIALLSLALLYMLDMEQQHKSPLETQIGLQEGGHVWNGVLKPLRQTVANAQQRAEDAISEEPHHIDSLPF